MNYSYQAVGDNLLFTVNGDLTLFNVSRLAEGISRAGEGLATRVVAIDASEVALIDSAAFGFLLKQHSLLRENGGCLCFINLRTHVRSALEQLHLDETLREFDSFADALELLEEPQADSAEPQGQPVREFKG